MIDINNYNELKNRNLEQDEKIKFPVLYNDKELVYITADSYLCPAIDNPCPETKILDILKTQGQIDDIDKYLSCLYGYECKLLPPWSMVWRECRYKDYAALSRVVYDIFEKLVDSKDIEKISLTNITIDFMNYGN